MYFAVYMYKIQADNCKRFAHSACPSRLWRSPSLVGGRTKGLRAGALDLEPWSLGLGFQVLGPMTGPLGAFWAPWGPAGVPEGTLEVPWVSLGVLLGSLGGPLGITRGPLGVPWGSLGVPWWSRGVPWESLGGPFGVPWGSLGVLLGTLGILWGPWEVKKEQNQRQYITFEGFRKVPDSAGSVLGGGKRAKSATVHHF